MPMLSRLPLSWKIALAASFVAASAFVVGGAYLYGRHDGKALSEAANAKATGAQISERGKTNAEVQNASDARKCQLIGGVFHDGACD